MPQIKGAFEAKKHAYRQTQDGVVIAFTVHPSDVSPDLAAAPLGTIFMVGYAEVVEGQEAAPEPAQPEEPAKERTPFHTLPLPTQTGILANDKRFQMWACGIWEEEAAAAFIRRTCGVKSRADISGNAGAVVKFTRMYEQYMIDTGQWTAPL
jgi:hypothetical protein